MKYAVLLFFIPIQLFSQQFTKEEISRWKKQASDITIIRDNWGIPHIYGKTDANAVFGLLYAQCEDDFDRVEMNYVEKLGRLSEVKGENFLYDDLYLKLVIDSADAKADYSKSPPWLHKLLDAFADGVNYYLYKHPSKKPLLLSRFKPWYPLLWTDGSIGAISTGNITANETGAFYSNNKDVVVAPVNEFWEKATGSNGFAFAPSITQSGHSILYINPHVTFFFRPEVQMVSEEGLNVYGAVTWGQFFVYQGFNEHCGWMHTSSNVDISDMYIEKIERKNDLWFYEYDHALKPVIQKKILLHYLKGNHIETKTFNTLFTLHGPVMAKRNGQWLSVRANNRDMKGLIQSWQRTKTTGFASYKKVMDLLANTSNNTVYADAEGNIAYWHGNFIPVRDPSYDWSKPVDGSTSETEWKGLHSVDESVHLYNPSNGWLQNCNSTPFSVAGSHSPLKSAYPSYMAPDGENFRGINAVRVLSKERAYTLDKVIVAGYDTYLTAFEILVPALVKDFEENYHAPDSIYTILAEPISVLKSWDLHSNEHSVATTVAIEWSEKITPYINKVAGPDFVEKTKLFAKTASPKLLANILMLTIADLDKRFGKWQVAWGEINRYQRISGDIDQQYDDTKPSIPVGFVSSQWGMLPSYASRTFPGTIKRYGVNGNSFICAVEFGKRIRAKSLLAGGESGDPLSPHFSDQAQMYSRGEFKDVLFYKEDVLKHAERTYHPGE